MTIDWQRVLPVLVSIGIIVAVAILRQYSKTFAAIAATMPINVPLALWIIYSGAPDDQSGLLRFFETMIVGLPPTFLFIVVAYIAARAGWGLLPMLGAGYLAWGIALALMLPLRALFNS
ncbi:MAG: hypothetical protein DIU68_010675 [Chloroflexota bacterium]|nr:MAG: hypothetical protein DIU68_13365 [Chloroflexota bacterium]